MNCLLLLLVGVSVSTAQLPNNTVNEIGYEGNLRLQALQPHHRDLQRVSPGEIRINLNLRNEIPLVCPVVCPPNTVQVKDEYCYRYVLTPKSWHDAKKDCEEQGGYLAQPDFDYSDTAAELSAIYRDIIGKYYIWVGATDMHSKIVWEWLNGDVLDSSHPSWLAGHPGNYAIENCAQIYQMKRGNLQIRKEKCTVARNFMCQFNMLNPVPTSLGNATDVPVGYYST